MRTYKSHPKATKRSHTDYAEDTSSSQRDRPFVFYGTPLPIEDGRDAGAFVPLHLQKAYDDQGRRRFHGAFTGGFSAGYHNTVGSKDGWAPSTFVSSRANRWKDQRETTKEQNRAEDYMDEEDLAELEASRQLQTKNAFSGWNEDDDETSDRTTTSSSARSGLAQLFRAERNSKGFALLRRMGWKPGQGIGPRRLRKARLDLKSDHDQSFQGQDLHLFAPDDIPLFTPARKEADDQHFHGIGYQAQPASRLLLLDRAPAHEAESNDTSTTAQVSQRLAPSEELFAFPRIKQTKPPKGKKKGKTKKGPTLSFGVGVLNESDSDEQGNGYDIGPHLRSLQVAKTKSKKQTIQANPMLSTKPVFIPKKSIEASTSTPVPYRNVGHDNRPPLDGFVLASVASAMTSMTLDYPPPDIPQGWVPCRIRERLQQNTPHHLPCVTDSTEVNSAPEKLDPRTRSGETTLPRQSVFEFMSAENRERIRQLTGRDLPPIPDGIPHTPQGDGDSGDSSTVTTLASLLKQLPHLPRDTAEAALARHNDGRGPYADDKGKSARYERYLSYYTAVAEAEKGLAIESLATTLTSAVRHNRKIKITDEHRSELLEFHKCAQIFKPMTGFMASKFAPSSTAPTQDDRSEWGQPSQRPAPSIETDDPANEAARMGLYGRLTRTVETFDPGKLVCKRFDVAPP